MKIFILLVVASILCLHPETSISKNGRLEREKENHKQSTEERDFSLMDEMLSRLGEPHPIKIVSLLMRDSLYYQEKKVYLGVTNMREDRLNTFIVPRYIGYIYFDHDDNIFFVNQSGMELQSVVELINKINADGRVENPDYRADVEDGEPEFYEKGDLIFEGACIRALRINEINAIAYGPLENE